MAENPIHAPTELGEFDEGAEVLLFETNPYGTVDAIVQQDGRTVYFYLNPRPVATNNSAEPPQTDPALTTKACWVRNLQTGPYVINEDEMRAGVPPLLPRTHLVSPTPGRLPSSDDLKIVWFEEGNGAALIETVHDPKRVHPIGVSSRDQIQTKTLAVIPPWSGIEGFHGYAAECAAESPLCWPLLEPSGLSQRIKRADEFWNAFSDSSDPFVTLQSSILDRYRHHFSKQQTSDTAPAVEPEYFSIDGGNFPPRGLVHFQSEQSHFLATVAMSLCPQPMVELATDDPMKFRRIELAIELPASATQIEIDAARNGLSRLAGYPWRNFRWLGHGHTCQFSDVFPGTHSARLVDDRELHSDCLLQLHPFRDDPVNVLWLVP